jgi:ribonuclease BN (tRNA processing enzyme)
MSKEFKLQMLGTGSAFGKKYYNNNAMIFTPEYNLMIDCGSTAPMSMHEIGLGVDKVNGIFISHIHGDHVNGLEEIAFRAMYIHNKKLDLIGEETMLGELWCGTLMGGLHATTEGFKELEDYFNVIPLKRDTPVEVGGITLEILKTKHVPQKQNYSLFINNEVFYSADVRFEEELIYHVDQERQCQVILHDCQLHNLAPVHAFIGDLLTLPPQAQEKIYLMHYGDNMTDFIGETGHMEFLEQHTMYTYSNGELR